MLAACLVLAVAASSPAMDAGPTPALRMMVLPPEVRLGVDARAAQLVSDLVVAEARRVPGFSVLSRQDVQELLKAEQLRQLTGCSDPRCVVDIGRVLDMDRALYGTVGVLGGRELVLTLTHLDVRTGAVLGGMAERLSGASEDAMLDAVPRLLKRLFPAYEPPPARVKPSLSMVPLIAAMTGLGAVVEYAAFASMVLSFFLPAMNTIAFVMSGAAFVASPLLGAFVMTYLLDALGRRVVGARHAAAAGLVTLALYGIPAAGWMLLGATLALGLTGSLVVVSTLPVLLQSFFQRTPPVEVLRLVLFNAGPTVLGSATTVGPLMFLGALVPIALGLVVLVPLVQAVVSWKMSEPRALDAEVSMPGLFSSTETPPGWLDFLPRFILGGVPPPPAGVNASPPPAHIPPSPTSQPPTTP